MWLRSFILALLLLAPATLAATDAAPWFVGFGKDALPGTSVCVVDPSSGTAEADLRTCIETANSVVTFSRCGTISCDSAIEMNIADGVWLAGNTCPSDGGGIILDGCELTLDNGDGGADTDGDGAQNVVITGVSAFHATPTWMDNLSTTSRHSCSGNVLISNDQGVSDFVLAHAALIYGYNKTFNTRLGATRMTFMNSVIGPTAYAPPTWNNGNGTEGCQGLGYLMGDTSSVDTSGWTCTAAGSTECAGGPRAGEACDNLYDCSLSSATIYGNLWIDVVKRSPKIEGAWQFEFTSNVVYNYAQATTLIGDVKGEQVDGEPGHIEEGIYYGNYWLPSYKRDGVPRGVGGGLLEKSDQEETGYCSSGNCDGGSLDGNACSYDVDCYDPVSQRPILIDGVVSRVYFEDNYGPWCGATYANRSGTGDNDCDTMATPDFDDFMQEATTNITSALSDCESDSGTCPDQFLSGGSGSHCIGAIEANCLAEGTETNCCFPSGFLEEKHSLETDPNLGDYEVPGSGASVPNKRTVGADTIDHIENITGPRSHAFPTVVDTSYTNLATANAGNYFRASLYGVCSSSDAWTPSNSVEINYLGETCSAGTLKGVCVIDHNLGWEVDGTTCAGCNELCDNTGDTHLANGEESSTDCTTGRFCIQPQDTSAPTASAGTAWTDVDNGGGGDGMDDAWEVLKWGSADTYGASDDVAVTTYTGPDDTEYTISSTDFEAIHIFAWRGLYDIPDQGAESSTATIEGGTVTGGSIN